MRLGPTPGGFCKQGAVPKLKHRGRYIPKLIIQAVLGLFCLVGAGCGVIRFGQLDPPPERLMITDVVIEGNSALSDTEIIAKIATYFDNLSLSEKKPLLDRAALPNDSRRIESLYDEFGYFDARVLNYRVEELGAGCVRVLFSVDEGEPVRVTSVSFDGIDLERLKLADDFAIRLRRANQRLSELQLLRKGEIWTAHQYEAGKAQIRETLTAEGFAFAEVLGDVYVTRETHQAAVQYHIAPGPVVTIQSIVVEGSDIVTPERILRRSSVSQGDVYNPEQIRRSEQDMYNLGVFFSVASKINRPNVAELLGENEPTIENIRNIQWDPRVTLTFVVLEMPMHELRSGVGLTVDNERGEAYVLGGYQDRNFFSGLRFFDAELKPALIVLPNLFSPEQLFPGGRAQLSFRQPSFLEEYLLLSTRIEYELGAEIGYQSHRVSGLLAVARKLLDRLTVQLSYHAEFYNYFNVEADRVFSQDQTLGLEFREQYVLSYLGQSLTLEYRDSIYDARQGLFAQAAAEESLGFLGSDFYYYRLSTDVRGYLSAAPWLSFAARIRYGQVFTSIETDVPLPARFQGGGPSSMRGFASRRMGPYLCNRGDTTTVEQDPNACGTASDDRIYVGGNLLLEGSLEARFYLPANFGLVLFADVGEVWARAEDIDFTKFHVAVGPGLRYFTPFGPIRLDLGLLLTTIDPPEMTFHFSIGQAF